MNPELHIIVLKILSLYYCLKLPLKQRQQQSHSSLFCCSGHICLWIWILISFMTFSVTASLVQEYCRAADNCLDHLGAFFLRMFNASFCFAPCRTACTKSGLSAGTLWPCCRWTFLHYNTSDFCIFNPEVNLLPQMHGYYQNIEPAMISRIILP